MKKLILFVANIYILAASVVSAIEVAGLGGLAASTLLPILKPIAEKAISATTKEIQDIIKGKKCAIGCRGPIALACKTEKGLSTCKALCQKIKQIGGYELRIRFGGNDDWSLAPCVRNGVNKKIQTKQGKGDSKSIAIYSKKDLKNLLSLISLQMAARQVIDSDGQKLKDLKDKDLKTVIAESKELIKHIDDSIAKNVSEGIYGNQ